METVSFTVEEEIRVRSRYQAEVPEGLNDEEVIRKLCDENETNWEFQKQVSESLTPGDPDASTIRLE